MGFVQRGVVKMKVEHTEESDAILRKHGTEIGKATGELRATFGEGWYWRKVRDRAIVLGLIAPEANLVGQNNVKVCVHTTETDAVIVKWGGNIKAACKELKWGNNRAVRLRAIELNVITDERRHGGPETIYKPTPETDAIFFKYPGQLAKCAKLVNWDSKAVRRRMVELEIIRKKKRICSKRIYKPTKKIDAIIRQNHGHVPTIRAILGTWSDAAILARAMELGVRTKGEHLPKDIKYIDNSAIDDVIRKYNGYAVPISNETGWGKEIIRKRAKELGIVFKANEYTGKKYTYQKMYIPTPEVDEIIRDSWGNKHRCVGAGIVVDAVAKIKALGGIRWSEGAVTQRAIELGLSKAAKTSGMKWSDDENQLLEINAHLSLPIIQLKLHNAFPDRKRTQSAIFGQIGRLRLRSASRLDGYNAAGLSRLIGIGTASLVRFTAMGQLRGAKREMDRLEEQGGGFWFYSRDAVREFILKYPEHVDLVKVDKLWFIDLISNGKINKQTQKEAA
jgi:hypothetical protein